MGHDEIKKIHGTNSLISAMHACVRVHVCVRVCTLYPTNRSEIKDFANAKKAGYGQTDGRTNEQNDGPMD